MATHNTNSELTALIKRAIRGNTQAFEQLISAFSEDIIYYLSLCLDKGNRGDAEDAAQEVVLVLYRNIQKLRSPHAFYAYVRTVSYNMALKYNLKASRLRTEDVDEYEQSEKLHVPKHELPEEEFERKQTATVLAGYMEQLPQRQCEALYLYYYRDLSYGEIAERLDVTTSTVGTNISKAKGALKKMLEASEKQRGPAGQTSTHAMAESGATSETERLGGYMAAPLIHDAINETLGAETLSNSAEKLVAYTHSMIALNPEVAAAAAGTTMVGTPFILKAAGALFATAAVAAGVFFGLQTINDTVNTPTETTHVTRTTYAPAAGIEFHGHSTSEVTDAGEPAGGEAEGETVDLGGADPGTTRPEQEAAEGGSTEGGSTEGITASQETRAEHIDPESATVTISDGTAGNWHIINMLTETVAREGSTQPAPLGGLDAGNYRIVFELVSLDGTGHAEVWRDFEVTS